MILETITKTLDVECRDIGPYVAEVEVTGIETDESFSHEFGIEKRKGVKPTDVNILFISDEEGESIRLSQAEESLIELWAEEQFVEEYMEGML